MDNREGNKPESLNSPADLIRDHLPPAAPPKNPAALDSEGDEEATRAFSPFKFILVLGLVALVGYLVYNFEISPLLKAALGLSFVIFIHELGHFLAAKWCDVNVTTFSIGFGPAIPGCEYKWGETSYRLAVLPLGGYVQMVGQVDGDESADSNDDDPRSYRRKSVGQRMLIISAGVIMNAILAACCFIGVYQGQGKKHPAAVISYVDSNAPAFRYGLPTGAEITAIGAVTKDPTFSDLTQTVINSMEREQIPISYRMPAGPEVSIAIEPRLDKDDSRPVLGVASPPRLMFMQRLVAVAGPYTAGSPAEAAGFQFDDVIVAMTDPDDPTRVTDLPDDPRQPGQRDYFEFARRLQLLKDKEIVVRVERTADEKVTTHDLKVAPMHHVDLGVRMQMGPILMIRDNSPAGRAGIRTPNAQKKLEGDLIEAVVVKDAQGKTIEFKGKSLDPERLPTQLRQWSDDLDRAGFKGERKVVLHVRRHSEDPGPQFKQTPVELDWDVKWRFDRAAPISVNAPMPIPELGLAYQIKAAVAEVIDEQSPLKVGDVIKNVRYAVEGYVNKYGAREDVQRNFLRKDLEVGQWANVAFEFFQPPTPNVYKKLVFKIERNKEVQEVEIPIQFDATWPLADRGWILSRDSRRVKANDPLHAVWMGLVDTNNRMKEIFLNLRGMFMGRIGLDNLGGPLTIAAGAYQFAGQDFSEFLFFIGLISINLAVVNFLPIPILDGGHMVFLIYEKIRGQPASEGVRVVATYVGLAMIGCLMIFVLYLDARRWFF